MDPNPKIKQSEFEEKTLKTSIKTYSNNFRGWRRGGGKALRGQGARYFNNNSKNSNDKTQGKGKKKKYEKYKV